MPELCSPIASRASASTAPTTSVVASDGAVWFTDPTYGIDSYEEGYPAESEIGACVRVPRRSLIRHGDRGVTDMVRPNGLALSVDERALYVADTGGSHVPTGRATCGATTSTSRLGKVTGAARCSPRVPVGAFDGFRLDVDGRIWTSGRLGVHCYDSDGSLLGDDATAGDVRQRRVRWADRTTLFMTATSSLYALELAVAGAR